MKASKFTESFSSISDTFQMCLIKVLNSHKPLSHKIADLSLSLQTYKTDILKSIIGFTSSISDAQKQDHQRIKSCLNEYLTNLQSKLHKLQFHYLLRRKIQKLQSNSMIHDSSSLSLNKSTYNESPQALMKSVLLIENDLGLDHIDEHSSLNISHVYVGDVVRRSMKTLQEFNNASRIKDQSQSSFRGADWQMNASKVESYQMGSSILGELEQTPIANNENIPKNSPSPASFKLENEVNGIQPTKQTSLATSKKQKRRKAPTNTNNKGMFDNLIQESLQSCFKK